MLSLSKANYMLLSSLVVATAFPLRVITAFANSFL
jgi:hypothetical protein